MPAFDDLFATADQALDGVFAGDATYTTAAGVTITLTASVRSLGVGQDDESTAPTSWGGYAVELASADLAGHEPIGGDTIAFGTQVYAVARNRNGRTYEPLDPTGRKILIFVKYRGIEN